MTHTLEKDELEQLQTLNKQADGVIFELGLASFRQYTMYKQLAELDQLNDKLYQEFLSKYGEGELNLKEGTFVTKDEK